MITQERLHEVLHYNPANGVFTWIKNTGKGSHAKPGEKAGSIDDGYLKISIDGKKYRGHRLAWLYMTGSWPKNAIDHINGDGANNCWENLRDVAASVNSQNIKKAKTDNRTGLLGAHAVGAQPGFFTSKIQANGKVHYLGFFDAEQKAHEAYIAAKRKFHEGNTL